MNIYSIAPDWVSLVESKVEKFLDLKDDYSDIEILVHNATWCPDCVRETTDLLAMQRALGKNSPSVSIIHYEDFKEYKLQKGLGTLEISCLPTIIFKKKGVELGRIEEKSIPDFRSLALKFMAK